jgi:hypothetical protein
MATENCTNGRLFSYDYYGEIIDVLKRSGKLFSFHQLAKDYRQKFVIMRHDVEFSVDRAYHLAVFEHKRDFSSTYFFQMTNNAYNVLSKRNKDLIMKIADMGHTVGLHFHLNGMTELNDIKGQIRKEIDVMSSMLETEIDSFSIHRPTAAVLKNTIKLPGVINAYDGAFFGFTEDMANNPPTIKYLSDARHYWNYGLEPDEKTINGHDKVQILIHPYSWTEKGYSNADNFKALLGEKHEEMVETIDSECKHFAEVRNAL